MDHHVYVGTMSLGVRRNYGVLQSGKIIHHRLIGQQVLMFAPPSPNRIVLYGCSL
jgi:hypothetical protein